MNNSETIDITDSLQSSDPFRSHVRELIDQRFPLTSDGKERHRNYDPKAEILDMIAMTKFQQAREEANILGEMPKAARFISTLEAGVATTLLAGENYGSQPVDDWFGTITVHASREIVRLYEAIKDDWKHEVDSQLGRVATFIVIGKMGFVNPESALGKMGIKFFESEKIVRKADGVVAEKEKGGTLPQGSSDWFGEFRQFLDAVIETPFEKVMKNYGCFDDPNSKEGRKRIKKIFEAKKLVGTTDPKIEAIARTLGVLEEK